MTDERFALAAELVRRLASRGLTVATAESCTGGWIAKCITDVAGSSAVFGYGFVCYSNAAKASLLDVDAAAIDAHGAVSEEVVRQMAHGALARSGADLAVAVSGIAGPDGGTPQKPVGTVCFAWAGHGQTVLQTEFLAGDRDAVRSRAVLHALNGLLRRIE